MDTIAERYIQLSFALDRHVPGFVDAYFGPPALRTAALTGLPPSPEALRVAVNELMADVARAPYGIRRRDYLGAQLRAMHTLCRRLDGEELGYGDEVRGCFDIEPTHTPEELFDEALATLDTLLPGEGPLAQRLHTWRQGFRIAPAAARELIPVIAGEVRRRSQALLSLPPNEAVAFELVQGKPWSGYNWYEGGYRSRVEINTDLPIYLNALVGLICHEAYPGHHTEHAAKEQLLYRERGYGEQAIQLISAPECVISEGIATLAESILFNGNELYHWQAEALYPRAGITGDPEREIKIAAGARVLRAVSANAALLLHESNAPEGEVVAYLARYGLRGEAEARHSLRFIADPLWRTYVFTYHTGRDLLGRWIAMGDRAARFRTLLTEQITPSLVEGWILEERNCCLG